MKSDTCDEILTATGRALCEHGYADLTMQAVAAESDLSTAAIHYHYDTKEGLLEAFLDHLLDQFRTRLATDAADPRVRMGALLDAVFEPLELGDGFAVSLMELKSQASFQATYRERFRDIDAFLRDEVAVIVSDGVDAGQFDAADPAGVARHVAALVDAAYVRTVALDEDPAVTRDLVESLLATKLDWRPEVAA
jgi:AcrR family transcriptional regulator